MFTPGSPEEMAETIQDLQGSVLTEDQQAEIEQWALGRELSAIVNTKAWQIAMTMLEQYTKGAQDQLMRLAPGDERVPAAHAAASALADQLAKFKDDVLSAVYASSTYPEALKVALRPHQ